MKEYKHSVSLDVSKCKGCTACLKRCPTEAIRIRDGHAVINSARCIDCGECIRVCSHKAKKATHDALEKMEEFAFKSRKLYSRSCKCRLAILVKVAAKRNVIVLFAPSANSYLHTRIA